VVEPTGKTIPVPCPRHHAADHVRQVPVVWADDTASLLSPRPVLKAADRLAWAGTGLGVAGMISVWIGNVVGGSAVGISLIAAIPCFAYALALYGLAAARRARLTRVERGMPNAMAVWGIALYCDHCGGVFFPPGAQRPRDLMTAAEFQRVVWSAGGYGDLSPSGPAFSPAAGDLRPAR
jgi:hypothetical protein